MRMKYILASIAVVFLFAANYTFAETVAERMKGSILLQVESRGEAWYVNPKNNKRYFLGRAEDAFNVMRQLGVGITNSNLNTIPAGKTPAPVPIIEEGSQTQTPQYILDEVCTMGARVFAEFGIALSLVTTDIIPTCENQYSSLNEPAKSLKEGLCIYTALENHPTLQQTKQELITDGYVECMADGESTIIEEDFNHCKSEATAKKEEMRNVPCDDNNLDSYDTCFSETKGQQLGLSTEEIALWQEVRNYSLDRYYDIELLECLSPETFDE